jgi:endoglucanase
MLVKSNALGVVLALMLSMAAASPMALADGDRMSYWDVQRKGANYFNERAREGWWREAREAGIGLVRLAPDKWKGAGRDFLLGDADDFRGIPPADLALLRRQLDCAQENGIRVVLTMLSLPGCRWEQNNDDKSDFRLWSDFKYRTQAAGFWRELAAALRDRPAIAGYDILNEPHPERLPETAELYQRDVATWQKQTRGTAADLDAFYAALISAVREVDKDTPVVVESGLWDSPERFCCLEPQADRNVLYSVHMYEPYGYTCERVNKGRFSYPSPAHSASKGHSEKATIRRQLNPAGLRQILAPVMQWQKKHGIPANRMFAAEFGCGRRVAGAAEYLSDVIEILNGQDWHWAFYAFREDGWDGLDYEAGTGPLPRSYYQAKERGEAPVTPRSDNPLWRVLSKEFGARGQPR